MPYRFVYQVIRDGMNDKLGCDLRILVERHLSPNLDEQRPFIKRICNDLYAASSKLDSHDQAPSRYRNLIAMLWSAENIRRCRLYNVELNGIGSHWVGNRVDIPEFQ
jgi:hypothetical protein